MGLSTYLTPSGFLLPSIHSAPPFFVQQPNPATQAVVTEQWTRLVLSYARHRRLFFLRLDDAAAPTGEWAEVLHNERINRAPLPPHLALVLAHMVAKGLAAYEPPRQSRTVLLHWRLPEEWAEVLHDWAVGTGQLNTILTFFEIAEPEVESPLVGIPAPLLRAAIAVLARTGRAQAISIPDGEGVRFFSGRATK
ncbi:ESCRT-II complex vps25 subunit [Vararia minispora EC-137]|uniref:ESCRT-II complex vps25 subunit n=1 Tax=Vararia minispora EC-137 TaxID=1314806 RepID=A0ACB8QH55_9AGAM|nr:ESCRT-II complex vps25 subunit [Vararia minispora EC-137]